MSDWEQDVTELLRVLRLLASCLAVGAFDGLGAPALMDDRISLLKVDLYQKLSAANQCIRCGQMLGSSTLLHCTGITGRSNRVWCNSRVDLQVKNNAMNAKGTWQACRLHASSAM